MSFIAEAFVLVKPNLSGFTDDLRKQLPKAIELVGAKHRKVQILPVVNTAALNEARKALALQPIEVAVNLTVSKASIDALNARLATMSVRIPATISGAQVAAGGVAGAQTAGARREAQQLALQNLGLIQDTQKTQGEITKLTETQINKRLDATKAATAATRTEARKALDAARIGAQDDDAIKKLSAKAAREAVSAETLLIQTRETGTASQRRRAATQARAAASNVELVNTTKAVVSAEEALVAANDAVATTTAASSAAIKASAAGTLKDAEVSAVAAAAKEQLATADAAVAAAAKSGDAQQKASAATLRQEALAAEQLARSLVLVSEAEITAGTLTRAQIVGTNKAAIATAEFNSAQAQLKILVEAEKAAFASGNVALQERVAALKAAALAQRESATGAQRSLVVDKETSKTQGAVQRATLATSASFVGLRGAVLSSTLPFLLTTIAVTALGKVMGQAGQVQQALITFRSVTGATADEMARVGAEAQKLGADVRLPATSATDAATAMTELAKAGLSVNDSIAAARGTLQLAAAAGIQAGDAAQISASQLNAFGLAGDQAAKVTDLLAGASIKAQGNINDFALAFKQSATVAHQSGLSIEQTTVLLTQLAKAGIQGSDAGTSLRTMLLRLAPTSKQAADAMRQFGLMPNQFQTIGQQLPELIDKYNKALRSLSPGAQTRLLRQIFGQDAIRAATILLDQNSAAYRRLLVEMSKGGFAAQITEARSRGLTGALDGTSSSIQTLAADMGKYLIPAAETIVREFGKIANATDKVINALNPLFTLMRQTIRFTFGGGETALEVGAIVLAASKLQSVLVARKAADAAATAAAVENSAARASAAAGEIAAQGEVTVATETATKAQTTSLLSRAEAYGAAGFAVVGYGKTVATSEAASTEAVVAGEAAKTAALGKSASAAALNAAAFRAAASSQIVAAREAGVAGTIAGLRGRLASRLGALSVGGLIGGIAAQQAGGLIGGRAGGILGAAGTGAIFGSFIGQPLLGAAAFTAIKVINDSVKTFHSEQARLRAKWNSLSFEEQQAVLRSIPATSPIANLPQKHPGFKSPVVNTAAAEARQITPAGAPPLPEPTTEEQRRQRELAEFALAHNLVPALDPRHFAIVLRTLVLERRRAVENAIRGLKGQIPSIAQMDLSTLIVPVRVKIPTAEDIVGAMVGPTDKLRIQVQQALADNNLGQYVTALAKLLARRQANLASLEDALRNANNLSPKDLKDLVKRYLQAFQDVADLQNQLTQGMASVMTRFTPALGAAQVAIAQAALTKTLSDDIAGQQQLLAIMRERLRRLQEFVASQEKVTLAMLQAVSDAKVAVAQQELAVQQAQQSQTDAQKTAAEKQKAILEDQKNAALIALQRQADANENIGAAENRYIAALQQRVNQEKKGTTAYQEALNALFAEKQKQRDAATNRANDILNLQKETLDSQLQAAGLTPTTADDRKILLREKTLAEKAIIRQQEIADSIAAEGKKATQKWRDAQRALLAWKNTLTSIKSQLQNLNGTAASFTIEDLFKEGINQFKTFGSNIAGRTGVLSPQDVRATIGSNVTSLLTSTLTEQQKQTLILKAIDENTSSRGGRAKPLPPHERTGSSTRVGDKRADFVFNTVTDASTNGYGAN